MPRSVHYRVRGTGESLLLIHGMGSSGADWGDCSPCLGNVRYANMPLA
jgi:pimeloyl-ACP methyl ester carboxylesterase